MPCGSFGFALMIFSPRGWILLAAAVLAPSSFAEVVIVNTSAFGGATAAATSYFATNLQQTSRNFNVFNPAGRWSTCVLAHALSEPAYSFGVAKSFGRGAWEVAANSSHLSCAGSVLTLANDGAPAMAAIGVSLASAGAAMTFYVTEPVRYFNTSVYGGGGTNFAGLLSNNVVLPTSGQLLPGFVYSLSGIAQVSTNHSAYFASSLLLSEQVPGSSEAVAIPGAVTLVLIPSFYLITDPMLTEHLTEELATAVAEFNAVPTDRWYRLPPAFGHDVAIRGNSLFNAIAALPTSGAAGQRFEVRAGTRHLGSFGAGERVDFVSLLGAGVRSFRITAAQPRTGDGIQAAWGMRLSFSTPTVGFFAASLSLPRLVLAPTAATAGNLVYFGNSRVRYQAERSSDLLRWISLGTPVAGFDDLNSIPVAGGSVPAFYRLQLQLD